MISDEQYDKLCELAYRLLQQTKDSNKQFRSAEYAIGLKTAEVKARHQTTLDAIDREITQALGDLPSISNDACKATEALRAKASQVLTALFRVYSQGKASGKAWHEPQAPKGVSFRFSKSVVIVDSSQIPSKYWSVDPKLLREGCSIPIPGVDVQTGVELTIRTSDEELRSLCK